MTPENLVPNKNLCEELAKYVRIETFFYWDRQLEKYGPLVTHEPFKNQKNRPEDMIPAPTASEIGEIIPIEKRDLLPVRFKDGYGGIYPNFEVYKANNEASARVMLAIYLYKQGILPVNGEKK